MLNFPGVTVYLIIMYIEKQHRNLPCWVEFLEQNIRLFPTCSSIPYVFFLVGKNPPWTARKSETILRSRLQRPEKLLGGWAPRTWRIRGDRMGPSFISHLVGGRTNPSEKYARQIGCLPKDRGENSKHVWNRHLAMDWNAIWNQSHVAHMITMVRITTYWDNLLQAPLLPKQSPFPSLPFPIHQLDTWNDSHQKSMRKKQDMKKNGATRRTPGGRNPWSWWGDCWTCTLWEIPILGRYFWVIIHKNPLMVVVGGWLLFSKTRIPPALFAKGL